MEKTPLYILFNIESSTRDDSNRINPPFAKGGGQGKEVKSVGLESEVTVVEELENEIILK